MCSFIYIAARKKSSTQSSSPSKRFWPENLSTQNLLGTNNQSIIDANIENISSNINRTDQERILAVATQKIADNFYSSDESNDSLVIDQDT